MPSQFDNGNELSFIPQQPLLANVNALTGTEFIGGVDGLYCDFWRIDWCSIVLSYNVLSLNASGRLSIGTSPSDLYPVIACASNVSVGDLPYYQNKYTDKNEQPFYLTEGYGFYIQCEESGASTATYCTGFVAYSYGFLAVG
jgi:hypothetical protein